MSFVCRYLGLLEPLRHLIVDLSGEKHIKVLILFITIEIGAFRLSVSSLLIFCKAECILFTYHQGSERPIFNLQRSITIASFLFVLICSEVLLNCDLIMSLSQEAKYS